MTTRVLVLEDDEVRRFEVFDDAGEPIGWDEESKAPVSAPCPLCGGSGVAL